MQIKVNDRTYKVSEHALTRMRKRKVKLDDLVQALKDIKHTRPRDDERYLIMGRNKVTAIITKTGVIVTVYPHRQEHIDCKRKQKKNKNRLKNKRKYGNRVRK